MPSLQNQPPVKFPAAILKKTLLYYIPPFLLAGVLFYGFHLMEVWEEKAVHETREALHLEIIKGAISHEMEEIGSDLKVLAVHHELESVINSENETGFDALTQEFVSFLSVKKIYDQVRLINLSGRETLRINRVKDRIEIVPEDKLQHKGDRYYVEETLRLHQGEIFLSLFDLNVEHGAVDNPPKAVIRIGTPLFDRQGKKKGILILNYLGRNFLHGLDTQHFGNSGEYLLVTPEGIWLEAPKGETVWGFVYPNGSPLTLRDRFPSVWEQITGPQFGHFFSEEGLITFMTIDPHQMVSPPENRREKLERASGEAVAVSPTLWKLVSVMPEEILYAKSNRVSRILMSLFAFFSLANGGVAYVLAAARVRHKADEKVLRKSELSKRIILETASEAFIQTDATGKITYWNHQAQIIFGWNKQEVVGKRFIETIIPLSSRKARNQSFHDYMTTDGHRILNRRIQATALHRSKGKFPIEMIVWPIETEETCLFNAFVSDITERKKANEKRRLADIVFKTAGEAITVTDVEANILSVNPAFTALTGYTAEEVIGKNPRILQSGKHDKAFYQEMWGKITTVGHWEGEIWNRRKNGKIYPEWLSITVVRDETGKIAQYSALFRDITKRKEVEEKLYYQAHFDPLTSLPNRDLFLERLSQTVKQTTRSNQKAALLFIDLGRFKDVNDRFGRLAGDEILKQTADRLLTCVREAGSVARSGGGEFFMLLPDITNRKGAAVVAEKVVEALSAPFPVNKQAPFLSISCGIAMAPDDGKEVSLLLKHTDMAMCQAKASGRNTFCFFSQQMEKTADARTRLEADLKKAMENHELVIHYQPIVDLNAMKPISMEALVRWNHPQKGLLFPGKFIPIAEASDLIITLDNWVIQTACRQAKAWRDRYSLDVSLSVNLSGRAFNNGAFRTIPEQALQESGLPAERLIIEVTEGLMLSSDREALQKLRSLKEMGIEVAVDDFGADYASLSTLVHYPFDRFKIDRAFIHNIERHPKTKRIVETIIRMGQTLGLKIVAEGIETDRERLLLTSLGCAFGQGHLFCKPFPAEAYEAVLKKRANRS